MDPHNRLFRRSLRDVLVDQGVLTQEQADELVESAYENSEPFGLVVVDAGYHTNLILLYRFDILSIDLKSTIPSTTLSNWKRRDISRIIGCDSLSGNDVSVLKAIAKS